MKSLRLMIVLMYVFVAYVFIDLLLTGRELINITQVGDALDLLKMERLFLVQFFKVIMDHAYSLPKLIFSLVQWIPKTVILLLVIFRYYVSGFIKRKYKFYFWIIPLTYLSLGIFISLSLQSNNPQLVIKSVNIAGYITFGLASMGILTTISIIFCFLGHLIDVREVIDYNDK